MRVYSFIPLDNIYVFIDAHRTHHFFISNNFIEKRKILCTWIYAQNSAKNYKEKNYHLKERGAFKSTIVCSSLVPRVRDHSNKHLINEELVCATLVLMENFAVMAF